MDTTENHINVAVCGAHMSGFPLNKQLVSLGGQLVSAAKTAEHYRLYKLAGFEPPRPGLIRVSDLGAAIDIEVWQLPVEQFGKFVGLIPAPLCIGTLMLYDGTQVQGFLCESYAISNALDITHFGGWRGFLDHEA